MAPHDASGTHQLRSGAARLARLAAVTCLALAAGSAAVWAQASGEPAGGHRCMHDELQQRVLRSVAQEQHGGRDTLSAVGLPYVKEAAVNDVERGAVDYALADGKSPKVGRSSDWGRLRITVSYEDLKDASHHCTRVGQRVSDHAGEILSCTDADLLTDEKRDMLVKYIIPQSIKLHTDRLKVKQVQGNWKVTSMNEEVCKHFKVPDAHLTTGLSNTDFVLYVASVPSEYFVKAWGAMCQVFSNGQPAVGVINVPAAEIVSRYNQILTRTVTHEIAHALGFNDDIFESTGILRNASNIRGKPSTSRVIKGKTTVAKAREQYGCNSLEHMELEIPWFIGRHSSHVSSRNAKDELMATFVTAGYYSALTMAIFEDTGFYKADFSKAEVMPWGRNASCDFFNKKCMANNITQWPQMFCNDTNYMGCSTDRLGTSVCGIDMQPEPLPPYFDYFTSNLTGGLTAIGDYCPIVETNTEAACDDDPAIAMEDPIMFNMFSDSARCIDGAFAPKGLSAPPGRYTGMCANVKCDTATQTYSIQVKGSRSYVSCTPGQRVTLSNVSSAFESGGYITCPPYVEVCQGNVQGIVDFQGNDGGARGDGAAGVHSVRTLMSAAGAIVALILIAGVGA